MSLSDPNRREQHEPSSRMQKRLLKINAISKISGIPVSTLYELVRQDRIGGVVRIGRHIRFDEAKFEAWLEAGGEKR